MSRTAQVRYSIRDSKSRWLALKLNIVEDLRAGAEAPAPIGSAAEGLPGGLLRPGYRHSAAHDRSR